VRPFGRLVYLMPPFVIDDAELVQLIAATVDVVEHLVVSDGHCVPSY
jgi:adenosylmethionine-8-amino-7-oxononanoate aminotransferase